MATKASGTSIMRTPLGQMRGLGSARSGTGVWWAQRLTAFALIPLSLWFVCAVIRLAGTPRAEVVHWAARPWVATLLIALIIATFHHLQLGMQVVIEDYVHGEALKLALVLLAKAACLALFVAAFVSLTVIAFAG